MTEEYKEYTADEIDPNQYYSYNCYGKEVILFGKTLNNFARIGKISVKLHKLSGRLGITADDVVWIDEHQEYEKRLDNWVYDALKDAKVKDG